MVHTVLMRNRHGAEWMIPSDEVEAQRARGLVEVDKPAPETEPDASELAYMDRELRDGGSVNHDPAYTEAVQVEDEPTLDELAIEARNAEPAKVVRPESTTRNDHEDMTDGQSKPVTDPDPAPKTDKRTRKRG